MTFIPRLIFPEVPVADTALCSTAAVLENPFGFMRPSPSGTSFFTGEPSPPEIPGTFGVTAGLFASVLGPKLFHRFVTQKFVEDGVLSPHQAPFVTLGATFGAVEALHRLGATGVGALGALKMVPLVSGLQTIFGGIAFDLIGLRKDAFTETGVELVSVAPVFFAQQSPLAAGLLGLGEKAVTLATPGAWIAGLGKVKLIDVAAGLGLKYGAHLYFDAASQRPSLDATLWDLSLDSVYETVSEELPGGKYLPNIAAASVGLVSLWNDYVWKVDAAGRMREKIEAKYDEKTAEIASQADALGRYLNQNLRDALSANIRQASSGNFFVDWDGVRRSVKAFYITTENKNVLGKAYDFIDAYREIIGFRDADTLTSLVDRDGNIADLEAFRKYFWIQLTLERREVEQELEIKAWQLEIAEEKDGKIRLKSPETPDWAAAGYSSEVPDSPEALAYDQIAFMNGEGAALSTRILALSVIAELLKEEK